MTQLQILIDRFETASRPGPYAARLHHHHDGMKHDLHVVIGCMVHGDEVGSLPAVVETVEALSSGLLRFGGRVTFFIGNAEAGAQDRRFLEADLNRVFVEDAPDNHEGRRAAQLIPILDDADIFLDLHQTIEPTDRAFYIFPWSLEGWQWARAIGGAGAWITRPPGEAFSPGTCCADEYVRRLGRPGLTLELGHKGFTPEAHERAANAIQRLLALAERLGQGETTLVGAATHEPDLDFLETRWRCAFTDPTMRLVPGLTNFQPVTEGTRLSADGTPEILAPCDGLLVFPKYGGYHPDGTAVEPRPGEIVRIVAPVEGHPAELWPEG